ncbi:MAG: hypothetical protein NVSMB42_23960 [Herpetosiphon sp.]
MQFRQLAIVVAAVIAIWAAMARARPPVVSNAPGLAGTFSPLGGQQAAAAAAAPKLGLAVVHAPTIKPAQIDQVLQHYHSPAAGQGQVIYDLGVKYGIDPAISLAFFIHESGAGSNPAWAGLKSDGSTTHNIGNIVCTSGYRCYGRFRDYGTWRDGIDDWYKLIKDLYVGEWGRTTVEEIIPKYAPAADNNNELAYINSVKNMVSGWQGGN